MRSIQPASKPIFNITELLFVRNKINCLIFNLIKKKNQWPNKAGDDFPWICKFTYTRTKSKRTTNCNESTKINHPRLLRFWFSHIFVHQWFPDFSVAITCVWHLHDYIYMSSFWALSSPQLTSKLKRDEPWSKSWVRRQKKCTKKQTGKAEDENNEGGNFFYSW